jgi:Domain of unknown function (DUF4347)/FG-GAP-like repeat/Bacterial Ig domain
MPRFLRRFRTYRPEMILEALEERIVLDAAGGQQAEAATENGSENPGQEQSQTAGEAPTGEPLLDGAADVPADAIQNIFDQDLEAVLISNALDQIQAISDAADPDAQVIVYDADSQDLGGLVSELQEMVDSSGRRIGHLALFTHGDPGILMLSDGSIFSAHTVESNPGLWMELGSLLTEDARIDLYGCDIGAGDDGVGLVNAIAETTGATVWASDDLSGTGQNADWDLEVRSSESDRLSLMDFSTLGGLAVTLDNTGMTNAGFETGDTTGWTVTGNVTVVDAATGGSHGGYDAGASPYASHSDHMLRIDSSQGSGDTTNPAMISQTFTLTNDDDLVFAYNIVTDDGNPYGHYDNWGYRLVVEGTEVLILDMHSEDVPPDVWQQQRDLGWTEQTIDLSLYANIGDTILFEFWAHNTVDTQYDTWAFLDLRMAPEMNPGSILDVNVFEDSPDTTIDLDNHFWDRETADVDLVFQIIGNTNPSLFNSISISDPGHLLTLDYAENAYGTAEITILVTDEQGGVVERTFTVNVSPVNDMPTADPGSYVTPYGTPIIFTVVGHDPDLHDATDAHFEIATPPIGGAVVASGALIHDGNGNYTQQFTYTPNANFYGDDSFEFTLNTPSGTWNAFPATSGDPIGDSGDDYRPYDMALVDLNDDGYLDLVEVNRDGSQPNYFYINDGTGGFLQGVQMGNDSRQSYSLAVGDVNGDGLEDVVVRNRYSSDLVYIWNPALGLSGAFENGVALNNSNDDYYGGIELGDMDGDGDLDIVMSSNQWNQEPRIYLNDGDGNFDNGTDIAASGSRSISDIALGDVNGDGFIDIVVGVNGSTRSDRIHLNDGNGNYTDANTITLPSSGAGNVEYVALGDVDADGDLDIVMASDGSGTASVTTWYRNDGGTTFSAIRVGSGDAGDDAESVRLADLDRDGDLDILLANRNSGQFERYHLFDSSTGQFDSGHDIGTTAYQSYSCAVGDIDNDGDLDFIAGVRDAQDRLFVNQGFADAASDPALVTIHVGMLTNWSFQSNDYDGWTMTETCRTSNYGTFAVVPNGTTILDWANDINAPLLYDHHDGNHQWQVSFNLPLDIVDADYDSSEYIAVQLGNGPRTSLIYQDVNIPVDANVTGITLQWRMAYWNTLGAFDPNTQYIAMYVSDPLDPNPTPVWTSSTGDPYVVDTLTEYSVAFPAGLLSGNVRVAFEVVAQDWFFETAIDQFYIIPTRAPIVVPTPSPVALAGDAVFGSSGANLPAANLSEPFNANSVEAELSTAESVGMSQVTVMESLGTTMDPANGTAEEEIESAIEEAQAGNSSPPLSTAKSATAGDAHLNQAPGQASADGEGGPKAMGNQIAQADPVSSMTSSSLNTWNPDTNIVLEAATPGHDAEPWYVAEDTGSAMLSRNFGESLETGLPLVFVPENVSAMMVPALGGPATAQAIGAGDGYELKSGFSSRVSMALDPDAIKMTDFLV